MFIFFSRLRLIFKDQVSEFFVDSPSSPSKFRVSREFAQSIGSAPDVPGGVLGMRVPTNKAEVMAGPPGAHLPPGED